jgi:phosphonate transport system substrate-binding protein
LSKSVRALRLTSGVSEQADALCRAVAIYLTHQLGIEVSFIDKIAWPERVRALVAGEIDIGWICGLLVGQLGALDPQPLTVLAAPVMQGSRYAAQPIYFSEVVVRRDSGILRFEDLRGTTLTYNEPNSFSGYHLLRLHLDKRGETPGFFGRVVASGAHSRSLELIISGQADTAAIDSTVLDLERQFRPELVAQLRTITVLGPHPIPPWVASRRMPLDLQQHVRHALLNLATSVEGQKVLAKGKLMSFVEAAPQAYEAMRRQVETLGRTTSHD